MQKAFAECAIYNTHRAFGYKLQPLSTAHLLVLEAIGSPVFSGEGCGVADMILAAKICAAPVSLVDGAYIPAVDIKATFRDKARCGWLTGSPRRLNRHLRAWRAYVRDYLTFPGKYETPGKEPKLLTAPAVYAATVAGMKLFGEYRVWSMPYGLLRACLDVRAESMGAEVKFLPDEKEQAEIERQLKEAEEAGKRLLAEMERRKK